MSTSVDQGLLAFRRLMSEASGNGLAKVDAIVALSQRSVFVATWAPAHEGFRTVINKNGESALPVFTTGRELMRAALRFNWTTEGGTVGSTEIGAREALRYAQTQGLGYVIVDIASPHSLEVERAEVEPLLQQSGRRGSTGPFAAVGRITSTMLEVVEGRSQTRPPSAGAGAAAAVVRSGSVPAPPRESGVRESPLYAQRDLATTPPSLTPPMLPAIPTHEVLIEALDIDPVESLLADLAELLREYPEVEWAAAFAASRRGSAFAPTLGLRVDAAYRIRLPEITQTLSQQSTALGMPFEVLLLDDPELIRQVRGAGTLFFPWVRRARA